MIGRIRTRGKRINFRALSPRLVILVPFLVGVIAWWLYSQVIQPQPIYINADPEVAYFLSSLSVFKGSSYTFVDHPGTPVEIIGTLILGMTYPFVGDFGNSFTLSLIAHPESFLLIVRSLLTFASICTMILLTRYAVAGKHWTDELAAVAVAVLFFGIHPGAFDSIVHWSHNSFSFPVGALLGLWMVLLVVDKKTKSMRQIAIFGFCLGILAAIQIYFATWIVGAVTALLTYFVLDRQGLKIGLMSSLSITLAAMAGFFFSTLPIVARYKEFFSWIVRVASHQGRHGSGLPGLISVKTATANLLTLWKDLPLLFVSIGAVVALIGIMALRQRISMRSNPGVWAIVLGLTLQIGTMCVLVIKHPGIIYMQAVAAIFPLLLAGAISLMRISIPKMIIAQRLIKFGLSIGIFFLFGVALVRAIYNHNIETRQVEFVVEDINIFIDDLALELGRDRKSINTLWVYGMPSDCTALWYGNQYADNVFTEEISSICPRDLYFNLWENNVGSADGTSVPVDQSNWDIIVLNEAALIDFPELTTLGRVAELEARLGTFGKVVYLLPW
ncbi:MAG: hypothetical protein E4G99_03655 [Anaerolineales bacterium]|nr:MAG: hypothetical protein E4G99_03655 [Anaerolineales bacterium]